MALGLPLLAGGRGGLGVLVGPSVGYFVGWLVGACVVGLLSERGGPTYGSAGFGANVIGGILVIHACGMVGHGRWSAAVRGGGRRRRHWFILGDLVKAVVAASSPRRARAYPGLLGGSRRRATEASPV